MSAFGKMKLGVAAASVACLAAGIALAQQAGQQRNATQLRDDVPGRAATDQADRTTQPQQRERIRTSTTQIDQRNLRAQSGGSNQEVEKFLAGCLLTKNKAEIEFAQLAQQQSQNPEIKEFAQKLEQDHQQLVQQLEPLAGGQAGQSSTRTQRQTQTRELGQNDAQRQQADNTRLPGSPGATQTTRSQTQTQEYGSQEMSGPFAQLYQVEKQIGERQKQAMMDELQQKSGAEFDKCYVGAMVGSHMQSLAALEVISQQQQGELAQVAQQAQPTVQQHLDHAKQLAKKLEGANQPGSQAERQRPRTQRQ